VGTLRVIESIQDIGPLIKDLELANEIGFDVEASSLDPFTNILYLIQLEVNGNIYVVNCLKFKDITYIISLIMHNRLVGHNIKYDLKVIYNKTGILPLIVYDTQVGEFLTRCGTFKTKQEIYISYEQLVNKYYPEAQLDKSVRESFYKHGILTSITQEQIIYSALDVKYLLGIKKFQMELLQKQRQLDVVDLESILLPVVAKMEYDGVYLNKVKWSELMVESLEKAARIKGELTLEFITRMKLLEKSSLYDAIVECGITIKTQKLTKELQAITSPMFYTNYLAKSLNLSSPKQVTRYLQKIGFKVTSSGEEILTPLIDKDPIIPKILEFRGEMKKGTSFGQGFLDKINEVTGRIHASFNQNGPATGRFACEDPNLQQILDDDGYRNCIEAPEGYTIVTVDYSQQELRLAAAISREPMFIDAFLKGQDLHAIAATILYQVPLNQVTKAQRSTAKGFNFATLYGSTEFGLAYNFKISVDEAREMINRFYAGFPTLAYFKSKAEESITQNCRSSTVLGRKRFFERRTLFNDNRDMEKYYSQMKREGFNHIIQGTGADVGKIAMCNVFYENPFSEDLKIIMVIHDELVFQVKNEVLEEAIKYIVKSMEDAERQFLGKIEPEVDVLVAPFWTKDKEKYQWKK
jgi:DNA polymerase I